jgi:hypothetical protein
LAPTVRTYDVVISALGVFPKENSHFMLEVLPGLLYVLEVLGSDFPAHILYEESSVVIEMLRHLTHIGLINASRHKLLPLQSLMRGFHDARVRTEGPSHIFAREVFYAAQYPGSCLTHSQHYAAPETSGRVRRVLAGTLLPSERRNLVLVIHRSGERSMTNEAHLISNLTTLVALHQEELNPLRFEVRRYAYEDYKNNGGIAGVIQLFKRAAVIVGVHGAGLSNIMFAAQCTTVVEILWTDNYLNTPISVCLCFHAGVLSLDVSRGRGSRTVPLQV